MRWKELLGDSEEADLYLFRAFEQELLFTVITAGTSRNSRMIALALP